MFAIFKPNYRKLGFKRRKFGPNQIELCSKISSRCMLQKFRTNSNQILNVSYSNFGVNFLEQTQIEYTKSKHQNLGIWKFGQTKISFIIFLDSSVKILNILKIKFLSEFLSQIIEIFSIRIKMLDNLKLNICRKYQ